MHRPVRWLWVGGIVTVVVVGSAVTYSNGAKPLEVQMVTVQTGSVVETVLATGTVEASQQVDLTTRMGGEVENLFVSLGDQVPAGTLVAQFKADALLLALREAEARLAQETNRYHQLVRRQSEASRQALALRVETAQLQVRKAQTALAGRQAALRDEEAKLALQLTLAEEALHEARQAVYASNAGPGARAAYDRAQADLEALRLAQLRLQSDAEFAAAQVQVELAQKELEAVRVAVTQDAVLPSELEAAAASRRAAEQAVAKARADLEATKVTASISGVVLQLPLRSSSVVGAGTPFMTIATLDPAVVRARVDEAMIGQVSVGQQVTVTSPALPDSGFAGRVRRIWPQAIKDGNATVIEVEVEFANPDRKLRPGMTVDAAIAVNRREQALRVPAAAVRGTRPDQWVWVVDRGVAQKRSVQVGTVGEGFAEVAGGLTEGETVITNTPGGFRDLTNGGPVAGEGN